MEIAEIEELRVKASFKPPATSGGADRWSDLVNVLTRRKQFVEDFHEMEEVRLRDLKRLVVPFELCPVLSELRELAEQLVDLETLPKFIEVEI